MVISPTLVWFRLDLRIADHPALRAAIERGGPVIPVFIWSPEEEGSWTPGAASRWWLHQSLEALQEQLAKLGSTLIIRRGPALAELRKLRNETGAGAVHWSRRYEPQIIARDAIVKEALRADGCEVHSFNAALLHEPWTIQNKSGKPFQVFTPFWKHCLAAAPPPAPLPAPKSLASPKAWPKSVALSSLKLEPKIPWAGQIAATWNVGAKAAEQRVKAFAENAWDHYSEERNRPDHAGTSRLSPHLHFGEISPRQVLAILAAQGRQGWLATQYVTEIGWREFAHHLLYHFPHTPDAPLRSEWQHFQYKHDPAALKAWCHGRTGYPIVDAGMRELWSTGWMHNRIRMIVASFLVKDLFLAWQEGALWFWDTLVDADLAANTLGWQWTAGCGADAAPYFRVFNPITQGQKFDPEGDYVRRWIPELKSFPLEYLHSPWTAPSGPPAGYPAPIVDHAMARDRALAAYAGLRESLKQS